ncbi:accessory gene regulator ArgB-like protein [Cellulosilyticum sp. I15G10I2]|uniref:accessory gene regulator ArgB-like protein n=1 Tax=Cellulosilyticum sp. I15G10I2 TaxID=1892843 RepID=UPI00085CBDFB|nr:accessory gene regulator B family protein [Cellulosilyticum sp. I15G10I2]
MSRVERVANQIAVKVANELQLDVDKKAVIAYGIFAFIHMFLCILAVIIVGAVFGVALEAFLISLTTAIFRKSSGGAHASKPWICNVEGVVVSVVPAILLGMLGHQLTMYLLLIIGFVAFIWAYHITLKLAPVDSLSKPIKKQATREKLKKKSILILNVYVGVVLVNILMFYFIKHNRFLIYSFCIYIGVIWQAFTLTESGHLLLNQVDIFLNNIYSIRGGRKNEKS